MRGMKTIVAAFATLAALAAVLLPDPQSKLPQVLADRIAVMPEDGPMLSPFVLPILSIHPTGRDYGVATGFVVDRHRRLVATAAHTGLGRKYMVNLPGGLWVPATRVHTNVSADVALLELPEGMERLLPPQAPLGEWQPLPFQFVVAAGWRVSRYGGQRDIRFRPVIRYLGVIRHGATLCAISLESCMQVIAARERRFRTGKLAESDRLLLYDRFVILIDADDDDHSIQYGLSGGPIVNAFGEVVGMTSMSNGYAIIAVPIDEITRLMQ